MTPRVSVLVPCLDEAQYVGAALSDLLAGRDPGGPIEVLVVDGMSTDGTREIVRRIAAADGRVRLLDNPRRNTPHALNMGIRAARGGIIARADAHARYPPDYLDVLTQTLDSTGAELVGCVADNAPGDDSRMARAIALATSGAFATASPFRFRRQSGAVDTVPFGCWRRELFDRVGLFDERLLRNQDNEHASRILRAGGRVHLTAETRVRTLVRSSLPAFLRHAARSGTWNAFTQRLCPYAFRFRHFLPGPFFLWMLSASILLVAGAFTGSTGAAAAGALALLPYATANLLASTFKACSHGSPSLAPVLALLLAAYHLAYGYGIVWGWLLIATGRWRTRLGVPVEAGHEPASRTETGV